VSVPLVLASCLLAAFAVYSASAAPQAGFETVGLYVWRDTPNQHAFWKACGINTLQFCDTHWSHRADQLDDYYVQFARDIESARKDGFRVYVILFSNIAQWQGPEAWEPSGTGVLFDPRDPQALDERLAAIGRAVRALHEADGFTFIAGDPGGAIGAKFGPRTVEDWMQMARRVQETVRREAPHAEFNVNPWAITYWQYPQVGCDSSEWWIQETVLTRRVLAAPDLIGPMCGVELPGHNYYRAMALRNFHKDGLTPDLCPTADDVRRLQARGAKRFWAWPYFLLDEADDGDVGPDGKLLPGTQIETRYIHRLVNQMRGIGMNGIIGNWSYAGYLPKALNTYAFGRFSRDPKATPEQVIDEYARYVADEATWPALAQVLRFIENRSNWQRKLPPPARLPDLPCSLHSVEAAQTALRSVIPGINPSFALPEPPAAYLARLQKRLEAVAVSAVPSHAVP
jgi:hypothetical protein